MAIYFLKKDGVNERKKANWTIESSSHFDFVGKTFTDIIYRLKDDHSILFAKKLLFTQRVIQYKN